ncbi:MAG: hypothetical protein M1816_004313 [Peltula sp. TS41687]|nr:MAG: hypothetical protein M1816_004313 [Peltula sp. TS41687]
MFFAATAFSMPFTPPTPQPDADQQATTQPPLETQQQQQQRQEAQPKERASNGIPTEFALTTGLSATIFGVSLTHQLAKNKYYKLGKKEGVTLYDKWQSDLATCFKEKSIEASRNNYEKIVSGLEECHALHPRPAELGEPLEQVISSSTDDVDGDGDGDDNPFGWRSKPPPSKKSKTKKIQSKNIPSRFDLRQIPDLLARKATSAMAGYDRAMASAAMRPNVFGGVGTPTAGTGLLGSWKMMGVP